MALTDILLFYLYAESPGGEGTPLYLLYRYVPPQRVWFLSRFSLKTGTAFDHYGLKSVIVFKETTRGLVFSTYLKTYVLPYVRSLNVLVFSTPNE